MLLALTDGPTAEALYQAFKAEVVARTPAGSSGPPRSGPGPPAAPPSPLPPRGRPPRRSHLRFLAALAGDRPDGLFFGGDLGQRIFQPPFSWKSLGVDVRGRSRTLRINYRTSHQIRRQADRLLAPELADVDGVVEDRRGAMSVFNGPDPSVLVLEDEDSEVDVVADWLSKREAEGTAPEEIGVIVRSEAEVPRACRAVERAGIPYRVLDEQTPPGAGRASISTMHMAKGLEFRAVAVMACGDEVVPLQDRIESVSDEADLLEVYDTERHLLYVAATRARDLLLVTGVAPGSEFIDDMRTAETDQF